VLHGLYTGAEIFSYGYIRIAISDRFLRNILKQGSLTLKPLVLLDVMNRPHDFIKSGLQYLSLIHLLLYVLLVPYFPEL
jgi:hypothetical protein